jgi:hypothetical protein
VVLRKLGGHYATSHDPLFDGCRCTERTAFQQRRRGRCQSSTYGGSTGYRDLHERGFLYADTLRVVAAESTPGRVGYGSS